MDTDGKKQVQKQQDWENPAEPKNAEDHRDVEQLERQKKEAERRKENLTETDHIDHKKKPD